MHASERENRYRRGNNSHQSAYPSLIITLASTNSFFDDEFCSTVYPRPILARINLISFDSSRDPGCFSQFVQGLARDKLFGQVKSFDRLASSRRIGPTSDMKFDINGGRTALDQALLLGRKYPECRKYPEGKKYPEGMGNPAAKGAVKINPKGAPVNVSCSAAKL
jgi:hypothetical protein